MTPFLTIETETQICLDALRPHVAFDLCSTMAELRKQAKIQEAQAIAPAQAKRILSGDLNALDLCRCWDAVKHHSDNPWGFLASVLPSGYTKICNDEYRRALSAIVESELWAVSDSTYGQEARDAIA